MTTTILCFGDSLTWGWVPADPAVPTVRHPWPARWTGVMAEALGPGVRVVEEGLNGRTTTADDPLDPRLNGSAYLPAALASHLPLDLVIVMLGTNDTKAYFDRTPFDIAAGVAVLLNQVAGASGGAATGYGAPRALLVAPPPLGDVTDPWLADVFAGGRSKSAALAGHLRALADFTGVPFFDAGSVISTGGVDGIHLTEADNRVLGTALAGEVRRILALEGA